MRAVHRLLVAPHRSGRRLLNILWEGGRGSKKATAKPMVRLKWATVVSAVRDCGYRLLATLHRPNQNPVSDWRRAVLWRWWRARKPKRRQNNAGYVEYWMRERTIAFLLCIYVLQSDVDILSQLTRHFSPYTHKSLFMVNAFDSVNSSRCQDIEVTDCPCPCRDAE